MLLHEKFTRNHTPFRAHNSPTIPKNPPFILTVPNKHQKSWGGEAARENEIEAIETRDIGNRQFETVILGENVPALEVVLKAMGATPASFGPGAGIAVPVCWGKTARSYISLVPGKWEQHPSLPGHEMLTHATTDMVAAALAHEQIDQEYYRNAQRRTPLGINIRLPDASEREYAINRIEAHMFINETRFGRLTDEEKQITNILRVGFYAFLIPDKGMGNKISRNANNKELYNLLWGDVALTLGYEGPIIGNEYNEATIVEALKKVLEFAKMETYSRIGQAPDLIPSGQISVSVINRRSGTDIAATTDMEGLRRLRSAIVAYDTVNAPNISAFLGREEHRKGRI